MLSPAKTTRATVIPFIRYQDEQRAMDWLHRAFGFERHLVVSDGADGIVHAELRFGEGILMLGSLPGPGCSMYVVVEDADALFARATGAGAEVVREIQVDDYGGRGFTCRDLEGNTWTLVEASAPPPLGAEISQRALEGQASGDPSSRLASEAAQRIAAGALNGRSVSSLAEELGVSERHLRRALRRQFGLSPVELAQMHRLILARRLLTETGLSVTRVAFASGFQSLRRFNVAFRECYGMSPSDLRRRSGQRRETA